MTKQKLEPKYWQAINGALADEMERDPSVVVFGQNVAQSGGTFGSTRGLLDRFGESRVRDTPISEQASVGAAVGAALLGLRPVIEIVFSDFLFIALDQVVNQAAKFHYFSGGRTHVPIVIKAGIGFGSGMGAQHAQSMESWYAHVPGLKIVWGATPGDAAGLLRAAIRDDDPVIFFESVGRYTVRGPVPDGIVELGTARIVREGDDVTIVTYGTALETCEAAADLLAEQGISCDLLDLRSIQPWDIAAVTASVTKTGRAVVVHDAPRQFGAGAEIASRITEECFGALQRPVCRIGAPHAPAPHVKAYERLARPGPEEIADEIRTLLSHES